MLQQLRSVSQRVGAFYRRRAGDATPEDSGAVMVELALVLPFLATFVLGVVDLGRSWYLKNQVTNAAREGGMVAQYRPGFIRSGCDGTNNVYDRANAEVADLDIAVSVRNVTDNINVTATPYDGVGSAPCATSVSSLASGEQVGVTVTSDFLVLTPAIAVMVGDTISVSGYSQMVVQG